MADNAGATEASAAPAFDAAASARRVLRLCRTATLATLEEDGRPFASLVTVATAIDGTPILLLSELARHTRNLARDARASLLLVAPGGEGGDPLAGARLTLCGRVAATEREGAHARRFLARHPEAAGYARFGDFGFRRFEIDDGHLVAGFGRVVSLPPGDLLTDLAGAEALVASEADAVAHMNEDHADAVRLYATRLCGAHDGEWRATGIDPDGMDLMAGDGEVARLDFPQAAATPQALRTVLKQFAEAARAG